MPYYILFDTETTGNQEEDRIIQFGSIIIGNKGEFEIYNELCSTSIEIKLEAMEVHNITPELIKNKPKAIKTSFYNRLTQLNSNENYLIAHNINFDLKMIEKENFINNYKLIDTLRCSRHLFEELPYHRLQYLRYALELYELEEKEAKKYNISIKAHDAIGDVLIMKLLLSKLVAKTRQIYKEDNPMDKLVELSLKPIFVKTFKFGKYKGYDIQEIAKTDIGYLTWMLSSMKDLDEDMKFTLNNILKKD